MCIIMCYANKLALPCFRTPLHRLNNLSSNCKWTFQHSASNQSFLFALIPSNDPEQKPKLFHTPFQENKKAILNLHCDSDATAWTPYCCGRAGGEGVLFSVCRHAPVWQEMRSLSLSARHLPNNTLLSTHNELVIANKWPVSPCSHGKHTPPPTLHNLNQHKIFTVSSVTNNIFSAHNFALWLLQLAVFLSSPCRLFCCGMNKKNTHTVIIEK